MVGGKLAVGNAGRLGDALRSGGRVVIEDGADSLEGLDGGSRAISDAYSPSGLPDPAFGELQANNEIIKAIENNIRTNPANPLSAPYLRKFLIIYSSPYIENVFGFGGGAGSTSSVVTIYTFPSLAETKKLVT